MNASEHDLSPTGSSLVRHQLISRWHSSSPRDSCRDRLLSRLRTNHEMRSLLVDKMRRVNINDINECSNESDGQTDEQFVDQQLQQMMSTDDDMNAFSEQDLDQLKVEVKREFLEEQNKYWNGLQTKEDQQKSLLFLNALQSRHAVLCPYCRKYEMQSSNGYVNCFTCGIRFETRLSIDEIIGRIYHILNVHSMSDCTDRYPQFNMFKSNLVIYCDTCPLNQPIL